jgi:D-threo-aldose 1-dehydrogenase
MSLPTVTLGAGGISTTCLGIGCANLFRASSAAQRARLLDAAYDAGIRHFDVAPMYGFGLAEPELGAFVRGRRAELIIATKFGIRPTPVARCLARVQGPVRGFLEARPALRDRARANAAGPSKGPAGRLLYAPEGYDSSGAKRSLERSLRALRTDYLDLILLHDPLPGSVHSDEVSAYLEQARTAGLIRSWGIAGEPEPTAGVARSFRGHVPVLQLRDDIFLRSLRRAPAGSAFITFGVLAGALPSLVRLVTADKSTRDRWHKEIGADCADPEVAASFLMRAALRENSQGVVLFSTVHDSRMRSAVDVAETFRASADPALDAFLRMAELELHSMQGNERAVNDYSGSHTS